MDIPLKIYLNEYDRQYWCYNYADDLELSGLWNESNPHIPTASSFTDVLFWFTNSESDIDFSLQYGDIDWTFRFEDYADRHAMVYITNDGDEHRLEIDGANEYDVMALMYCQLNGIDVITPVLIRSYVPLDGEPNIQTHTLGHLGVTKSESEVYWYSEYDANKVAEDFNMFQTYTVTSSVLGAGIQVQIQGNSVDGNNQEFLPNETVTIDITLNSSDIDFIFKLNGQDYKQYLKGSGTHYTYSAKITSNWSIDIKRYQVFSINISQGANYTATVRTPQNAENGWIIDTFVIIEIDFVSPDTEFSFILNGQDYKRYLQGSGTHYTYGAYILDNWDIQIGADLFYQITIPDDPHYKTTILPERSSDKGWAANTRVTIQITFTEGFDVTGLLLNGDLVGYSTETVHQLKQITYQGVITKPWLFEVQYKEIPIEIHFTAEAIKGYNISGIGDAETRINEITADNVASFRNFCFGYDYGIIDKKDHNFLCTVNDDQDSVHITDGMAFAFGYCGYAPASDIRFMRSAVTSYYIIYAEFNKSVVPNDLSIKTYNNLSNPFIMPNTFRKDKLSVIKTGIYQMPLWLIQSTSNGIDLVDLTKWQYGVNNKADLRPLRPYINNVGYSDYASHIANNGVIAANVTCPDPTDSSKQLAHKEYVYKKIEEELAKGE